MTEEHQARPVAFSAPAEMQEQRPTCRTRSTYLRVAALAAILGLALGFRLWGIAWGLHNATVPLRPHPDEWAIYWLFHWFEGGNGLNPCPSAPGRCFFDWGMAFPYAGYLAHFLFQPLLGALPLSLGPKADPSFVWPILSSRVVSALFSTASVGVAYLLARNAYGPTAALISALLLALATLSIQLGHFATPDSTTALLVSVTLLAGWRAIIRPSGLRFALAGAAAGLAAGSEYHMVLLAIPIATAWLLSRGRVSWLAAAGLGGVAAFVAVNPYAVAELPAFVAAGEHAVRMRTVDSGAEYGDRFSSFGPAWLYVVRYALGYGVGWPVTVLMMVATAWAGLRRTRADYFLFSWLLPYFLLVSVSPAKFMRYSAPLLIPLAILAGRVAVEAAGNSRLRAVPTALALIAVCAYTAAYDAAYVGMFASPDTRATATAWLMKQAPRGAYVGFPALPDGLLNLPYFTERDGFRPCVADYKIRTISAARYILFDGYVLEEHPRASDEQVASFQRHLVAGNEYALMKTFEKSPRFLGLTFSIGGSPHDWRYPSHSVMIYARRGRPSSTSPNCFANLKAATAALYSPARHT